MKEKLKPAVSIYPAVRSKAPAATKHALSPFPLRPTAQTALRTPSLV